MGWSPFVAIAQPCTGKWDLRCVAVGCSMNPASRRCMNMRPRIHLLSLVLNRRPDRKEPWSVRASWPLSLSPCMSPLILLKPRDWRQPLEAMWSSRGPGGGVWWGRERESSGMAKPDEPTRIAKRGREWWQGNSLTGEGDERWILLSTGLEEDDIFSFSIEDSQRCQCGPSRAKRGH